MNFDTTFAPAWSATLTGKIRQSPSDFMVDEQMDIALSGEGEHLWLQVQKTNANTEWVAGQLARIAGIAKHEVGFAGLKDRHAVTTQWFSLPLPRREIPDFEQALQECEDDIHVLQQQRHDKKLRRGALTGNQFILLLRDCQGDLKQAQQTLQQIATQGMPNYFGTQRFGHNQGNLLKAERWFQGDFKPKQRSQRSLYLSAARSWIFNHVLSTRVQQGTWNQRMVGDVFMFEGGNSWFVDDDSPELAQRLAQLAIHPTGVQWGRGELASQAELLALEQQIAAQFPVFCAGLEKQGLKQERRALRVKVDQISSEVVDDHTLKVCFTLPAGAYATVLLAQLGQFG